MTDHRTAHDSFTIERIYPFPPARVFAAWSSEEGKEKWFSGPNEMWDRTAREFDFRVGGIEVIEGRWKDGTISRADSVYVDIVPDRRIIHTYWMKINGKPISASLTTVEFFPHKDGTRFVLTEHGVYLDDHDDAGRREHGVTALIDKMGETL